MKRAKEKKAYLNVEFLDHVRHPRYGKGPRFTALKVELENPLSDEFLQLFSKEMRDWFKAIRSMSPKDDRIPGTALKADTAKQVSRPVPLYYYWDRDLKCDRCGKHFLFFAAEQKHWYEVLGFPPEARAKQCPVCRKGLQKLARQRRRYEELVPVAKPTPEEAWEFADCALSLVEEGLFGDGPLVRVKSLLKKVPPERRTDPRHVEAARRLAKFDPTSSKTPG